MSQNEGFQEHTPALSPQASQQHPFVVPLRWATVTDNATLMATIKDLRSEMSAMRSEMSSLRSRLESWEARSGPVSATSDSREPRSGLATPTSSNPFTPSSPAPSASSALSVQQPIGSTNLPTTPEWDEEWDPEEFGYFHGNGDDVHAFVDRLSMMAPRRGVRLIQANLFTLLKDNALNWYYCELSHDTRAAFDDDASLDPWCQALIKRFVPSYQESMRQLEACHYTRKDAANKKDAIDYIHRILRIARCLEWSRETGLYLAYNHFEAHLQVHLNPDNCSISQFIKQVQLRQDSWFKMYASFGKPSIAPEPKLHQQPSRPLQSNQQQAHQPAHQPHHQTHYQPHYQPRQQQYHPPVRTPQQTYQFEEEEEEWMYDPPTDSHYPAPPYSEEDDWMYDLPTDSYYPAPPYPSCYTPRHYVERYNI